jgi:hypothetical protein
MNIARLSRLLSAPLALCAAFTVPTPSPAQSTGSPKILMIEREFTKPGKDGSSHEATESAFVRAVKANNGQLHYTALTSITGVNRALFFSGYSSFAAVEAERKNVGPTLGAALDKAMIADGDLLSGVDSSAWIRRDDLSTNVAGPRVGSRYMEVTQFVIKPGHVHEWNELVKMYLKGAQGIDEMHWTAYELAYGHLEGPAFLVLTALKSGDEIDAEFAAGKRFDAALSEEEHKKMGELEAACIQTEMTNLFAINAKMSIPTDDMVKSDPDFWKPKAAATAAKKPAAATKPAPAGQ